MNRRRRLLASGLGLAAAAGFYSLSGPGAAIAFGFPSRKLIASSKACPQRIDAVIIGGGVIGLSTALSLLERGLSVVVLEKGRVGGEASGKSYGLLEYKRQDPRNLPLLLAALTRWQDLAASSQGRLPLRQQPCPRFFDNDTDEEQVRKWLQQTGLSATNSLLNAAQTRQQLPDSSTLQSALTLPHEASLDPEAALTELALRILSLGGSILQHCAALGIERHAQGVSAVYTEIGRIATRHVILTGGAWSPLMLASLGIRLPLVNLHLSAVSLAPNHNGPDMSLELPGVLLRREDDGGYVAAAQRAILPITLDSLRHGRGQALPGFHVERQLCMSTLTRQLAQARWWKSRGITPFEATRFLQPRIYHPHIDEAYDALATYLPVFEDAWIRHCWAAVHSSAADDLPVISRVPGIRGLLVGTGFSRGFTAGPAMGEALADMAIGEKPAIDVTPFAIERF